MAYHDYKGGLLRLPSFTDPECAHGEYFDYMASWFMHGRYYGVRIKGIKQSGVINGSAVTTIFVTGPLSNDTAENIVNNQIIEEDNTTSFQNPSAFFRGLQAQSGFSEAFDYIDSSFPPGFIFNLIAKWSDLNLDNGDIITDVYTLTKSGVQRSFSGHPELPPGTMLQTTITLSGSVY